MTKVLMCMLRISVCTLSHPSCVKAVLQLWPPGGSCHLPTITC